MDERMRFVIRLKDGETMAALCREFGISRKTGYKIFERYQQCGLEGLSDRARRPFRYANQLPEQVEAAIVSAKREKPHWGARKIRERLLRRLPHAIKTPAASTIHAVLDRHGLVTSMGVAARLLKAIECCWKSCAFAATKSSTVAKTNKKRRYAYVFCRKISFHLSPQFEQQVRSSALVSAGELHVRSCVQGQ